MRIPLTEVKELKNALGGTVNDVVLALTAGAMRKLLLARGEEPPARGCGRWSRSTSDCRRAAGARQQDQLLFVALPVAGRPLERFKAQVQRGRVAEESGSGALGAATMIDVSSVAPPMSQRPGPVDVRDPALQPDDHQRSRPPAAAVRPRLADARGLADRAAGGEHAIALAVLSYDGELFFTFNADRDAVPDLDVALEGIEESLAELHALSARA